ncbi:MAG: hypothetical protein HKN35_02215 [Woeseia sp.]|nr:hypothetical protein [Woeseia sp.]MBT8097799.1 hypothetical protein [Woeseia sp.]NNE59689.1 hypothetical protein [Woeseia sp.]NNL56043.1 hypothetical protein [Woeseia sp.]
MSFSRVLLIVGVLSFLGCAGQASREPAMPAMPPEKLGKVHFETSCSPAVADDFDRAMALLHSFWFSAAIKSFDEVAARDPGCAMAHWGIAMSWWGNPFSSFRPDSAIANGALAVAAAKTANAKTARERDYIAAVEILFEDAATVDQRSRTLAYEKAMKALADKYPDDSEARIYYALSMDQNHLPTDKTYAKLLAAAAILEEEFETQPDHPGIAHYIIHSYDVPILAARGVDAARRYAGIAPDAPHALHMPSHTFTRIGAWQESIETNLASAAAARKDNAAPEELHALDYQVYAYLQTGQDAAAKRVLDETPAITDRIETSSSNAAPSPAGYFAAAAIAARYALERNAWAEAAVLPARETRFEWVDATTYFARALGAARSGDVAAARQNAATLAVLHKKLTVAGNSYWSDQVAIQEKVAGAWIANAEGRTAEGLTMLRDAVQMEDATEKSAISPGPIKPARELLGEMLLEHGRPAEALAEFESTMQKEPNRFRAIYGAAVAAQRSGDTGKAQRYFGELLKIAARADAGARPELNEARESIGD